MIKNMLKQLWNRRESNAWIALELFLISIFLWVLIHQFLYQWHNFNRPMGFDISDTYLLNLTELSPSAVGYVSPEVSHTSQEEDILNILSRIRRVEGVEEVSVSQYARPYSPGNTTGYTYGVHGADTIGCHSTERIVSPEYFRVFRIKTPDGKAIAGQTNTFPRFVLSKDMADSLRVSRGDSILKGNGIYYAVDLCTPVRYAESWPDVFNTYNLRSEANMVSSWNWQDICVRLRPGMTEARREALWKEVADACHVNNYFLFYRESFQQLRKGYLSSLTDRLKSEAWVAVFLVVNMLMGIIGTFWLQTQQRRAEIGIRMAMGASRRSLFGQFVGEGLLLLSVVFPLAAVVVLNLWHLEILSVDGWAVFVADMVATWIVMALMIVVGVWYPARRAMQVNPAEVLHEE